MTIEITRYLRAPSLREGRAARARHDAGLRKSRARSRARADRAPRSCGLPCTNAATGRRGRIASVARQFSTVASSAQPGSGRRPAAGEALHRLPTIVPAFWIWHAADLARRQLEAVEPRRQPGLDQVRSRSPAHRCARPSAVSVMPRSAVSPVMSSNRLVERLFRPAPGNGRCRRPPPPGSPPASAASSVLDPAGAGHKGAIGPGASGEIVCVRTISPGGVPCQAGMAPPRRHGPCGQLEPDHQIREDEMAADRQELRS